MAVNCVNTAPYEHALQDISAHRGIPYWDDVAIHAAENQVFAADGDHWNEKGHEPVAQAIAKHFHKEVKVKLRP